VCPSDIGRTPHPWRRGTLADYHAQVTAGQVGPDELPRLGSLVGRYRLDALLGRGGMGVVFRATDQELERAVAIKFLSPELAEDAAFRDRFVHESRLAAAIEHPAIVPIYEAGTIGGSLFIAMRYVPGRDLGAVLRSEAPLELERTLALARSVAEALDAAHRRGLVHRDVKPANVLVERNVEERAYLTDFGLSRRIGEPTMATLRGPLGTIDYAAPEQVRGDSVDGRADQYALACLVMHCLTGAPPFEGDSEASVLYAQVHTEAPRLSERDSSLPESLDAPLAQGLSKEPNERFADCVSLIEALASAVPTDAVTSSPAPPSDHDVTSGPEPPQEPRRHSRAVLLLAGVALLMMITLAIIQRLMVGAGDPGDGATATPAPAARPGSIANLRDDEVIVFASDRDGDYDLYALHAGVSTPVRLRDTSRQERSPAISPDGTTIAYVVGVEPRRDIWLMDIDGRRPRRLTQHAADDADPAWSSDSKRLAFASRRSDALFDIWEIRDRGSGLDERNARRITDRRAVEHYPAWYPGTRELAIASNHFGGNRDIFRIDVADTDALARLTSGAAFDFGPAVSPDGKTIAFYRRDHCEACPAERGQADIVLMNAAGRSERRLTRTNGRDEIDPDWSPDGRALVYAAGPRGATELYARGADGQDAKQLTKGWPDAVEPSWGALPSPLLATPRPSGS